MLTDNTKFIININNIGAKESHRSDSRLKILRFPSQSIEFSRLLLTKFYILGVVLSSSRKLNPLENFELFVTLSCSYMSLSLRFEK